MPPLDQAGESGSLLSGTATNLNKTHYLEFLEILKSPVDRPVGTTGIFSPTIESHSVIIPPTWVPMGISVDWSSGILNIRISPWTSASPRNIYGSSRWEPESLLGGCGKQYI